MARNWQYIVLHHSATKDGDTMSWSAIKKYHVETMGWRDIGYHFGIEYIQDSYVILVGRLLHEDGAHCKEANMNRLGIGICFVGNFDVDPVPPKMWELGVRLVGSLCNVFNIPYSNIAGHRAYAPYKSCPGSKFDIEKFISDVRKIR